MLVFALDVSQWLGFIISSGGAHSFFGQLCVFTHTCGARTVVAHWLIGGSNSLGGQSRERGGKLVLILHLTPFLATGCIGRLWELILMLENLIK